MRQLTFKRTIGAGAFGTVYQAELQTGRGFQRQVAVKVIQARGPDGDMFLSRIRDEARLLGLLQDDAILKVLDMVRIDGVDAVVMEYIEGVDLDSIAKDTGAPSPMALAELGALVAGALHRAHTAVHPADGSPLGVIHRDVKPANIMVTRSGGVRLLDFGVARAKFEARESYTGQLVLGTLNYMAPEYIVTNQLSPAADIYGLGLSLYEAATGQVFGQPKVRQDSHQRRLDERVAALSESAPALALAVERMLAWDPAQRPDGAEAERLLWEISSGSRGPSLRQWATSAVPRVLDGRPVAQDDLGLVGRTVPLADEAVVPDAEHSIEAAPEPAKPLQSAPTAAPTTRPTPPPTPPAQRPQPGPKPPVTPSAPATTLARPAGPPPRAPHVPALAPAPAPPKAAAAPAERSLVGDVLKGLLLGGVIGVVLLVGLILAFVIVRL